MSEGAVQRIKMEVQVQLLEDKVEQEVEKLILSGMRAWKVEDRMGRIGRWTGLEGRG